MSKLKGVSAEARVFTDWDNECGKSVASDDSAVVHDVLRHNFNKFAVGVSIFLLKLLALSQRTRSVEHSGSCSEVFCCLRSLTWQLVLQILAANTDRLSFVEH